MAREVVESTPVAAMEPTTENITTLTTIISQSLQSGDTQMLETALGITDPSVIEATLQKLSGSQVPLFIEQLVKRLQGKSGRLQHLLPWIRGCIIVHATTLMSNPSSASALQSLQSFIDQRLESHDQLLKLAGRLDLMMMQALRRTDAVEAVKMAALIHNPVAVYEADDDSEDDQIVDDQDQEDSDDESDEMSVDGSDEFDEE